jgi:hypothetical protein
MKIAKSFVRIFKSAAKKLKGAEKRQFMADAVNELGRGGQRACENQLGWCRNTIRKGQRISKYNVVFFGCSQKLSEF